MDRIWTASSCCEHSQITTTLINPVIRHIIPNSNKDNLNTTHVTRLFKQGTDESTHLTNYKLIF